MIGPGYYGNIGNAKIFTQNPVQSYIMGSLRVLTNLINCLLYKDSPGVGKYSDGYNTDLWDM